MTWWMTAAALAAAMAGCSTSSTHKTAATAAPSSSPSAPSSSVPTTSPTPTASALPTVATTTACASGQLTVTLAQSQSGAGSTYTPIVFTNHGGEACRLAPYPGVSLRDAGGQLGPAAVRDTSVPSRSLTLVLHTSAAGGYDPASCKPRTSQVVRVYPPGLTTWVDLPMRTTVCSTAVAPPQVLPVTAGS
jgi:glucose/arabinose dehydrogenase